MKACGGGALSRIEAELLTGITITATAPSASVKIVVDVADLAGQVAEETVHT